MENPAIALRTGDRRLSSYRLPAGATSVQTGRTGAVKPENLRLTRDEVALGVGRPGGGVRIGVFVTLSQGFFPIPLKFQESLRRISTALSKQELSVRTSVRLSEAISMTARENGLSGIERRLDANDLIVSKTDLAGRITYANRTFMDISGYSESELLGKPHNILRHPAMPRCVFRYLWDTISSGKELFAYVINRCKNGDHYWVYAHVTPTFDHSGKIVGYHSNRRAPLRTAVRQIEPLYRKLLDLEANYRVPRDAWQVSLPVLVSILKDLGQTYDEFIASISPILTVAADSPTGIGQSTLLAGAYR